MPGDIFCQNANTYPTPQKAFFVKKFKKLLYAYSTTQQRKSRLAIDVIDVPKCINTKMKRVKHLL